MPEKERERFLSVLLPRRLLTMFSIDPGTFRNDRGVRCVRFVCPERMPFFQVDLRRDPDDRDAAYFLDLSNSVFGQMEVSFIIVNDPGSERFDIDVDEHGQDTYFGTARRNVPEEIRAMKAGVAPGRARRGGAGREKRGGGKTGAIHDGTLDTPWEGPKMYKTIGVHAGTSTFTGEGY